MKLATFFEALWRSYISITPQAEVIHQALSDLGESIVNDHVAFRTFNVAPISLSCLEPHLFALGYQRLEAYQFPQKKLRAFAYLHKDPQAPRVFLSELLTEQCSPGLQTIVQKICTQIPIGDTREPLVLNAGRLWPAPRWADYQALLAESEYAAWVAALGLRANHFTISVNALQHYRAVADVADFVESIGFPVSTEGGRIKGGPDVLLEQASTRADRIEIGFADHDKHVIPTCYYEFARRYPDATGHLYQGFVTASADRIFESTHVAES